MDRLRVVVCSLLVAFPAAAQPKEAPEPFTFDPQSKPLQPAAPIWWNVAVSPDGKTIVTAHAIDGGGEWWVWDAEGGEVVAKVREPNVVRFVAFSPDGALLATGNFDNAVRLYDAKTRKLLAYGHQATGGHTGGVNSLSFSGDGAVIATAGLDKTVRVWDVAEAVKRSRAKEGSQTVTMAARVIFEGHEQAVYALALSPDGKTLVSSGPEGSIRMWKVPSLQAGRSIRVGKEEVKIPAHGTTVECLAYSPDGSRFASGSWDHTARLFDAAGKEIAVLRGHNRGVMALAFSPDSKRLVTCSGDHNANVAGEIRLWDAADGKDRGLLGRQGDMALGVAFGPGGKTVVSVGRDRVVRVWDVDARSEARAMRPPDAGADDANFIHALAYSPDGSLLAVAGDSGAIALWDVQARKRVATLERHTDAVYSLAWAKEGGRLASASADHSVIIWDASTKNPVHVLKHPGVVYAVAMTADGKTVATGGFDKAVRIWDADSGQEKAKKEGHTASVRCVAFDATGTRLASGGSDYSVRVWDVVGAKPPQELRGHSKVVRAVRFLPDGTLVSAGDDRRIHVWNLTDGEPRHTFGPYADAVLSLGASPRGTFIVAGLATGAVTLCDPKEGQSRAMLTGATDAVTAVDVAPDGQQIAAAGFDRTVRLWTAGTKTAASAVTYAGHSGPVRAVAVSPDGELTATGAQDGVIRLFDATTGGPKVKWEAHPGGVEDLAFSRDGKHLVSGGADKRLIVWRIADRQPVTTVTEPGPVRRVAISEKGTLVAWGTTDNDIRVRDVAGESIRKLPGEAPPDSLQFLADDTLLSAGGPRAYLWDVSGSRVLQNLDGGQFARVTAAAGSSDAKLFVVTGEPAVGTQRPEDIGNSRVLTISFHHPSTVTNRMNDTGVGVTRAVVCPEGRIVAAVGGDGTVRVWEWPGLSPIRKFTSHSSSVLALASSTRGEYLVTASADGTAKRWTGSRGEPLVYAARLTDESKQAWFARQSPDGKVLATGGDDRVLRLRDAVPGKFRVLPGDYQYTFSTATNADGSILATGHLDGTVHLWDLKTGKPIRKLEGSQHRIWSLAFSPDGTRLVAGAGKWDETVPGEIRVWDTSTWKTVHEFAAHDDLVFAVAVSPDNKAIASGSRDQSLRTWEMATGKEVHTMRRGGYVRNLAFTNDGKRLYSCGSDGELRWWDPQRGEEQGTTRIGSAAVERLRLSQDGKYLGLALRLGNLKYVPALWDVSKNQLVRQFQGDHPAQINDLAFSPDGQLLVVGGGHYQTSPRFQPGASGPWVMNRPLETGQKSTNATMPTCEIHCWNVATGTPLADLAGHKFWLEAVHFTPDGRHLVTAGGAVGEPGEIRLWDTAGLRPKAVLGGHTGSLTCGRFNPDGTLFATGSTDYTVIVWDVARALAGDGSAKKVLKGHKGLVRNLAWSADGSRLVSSAEDGVVIVWDPKTSDATLTITAHDCPVYGVVFSPDGAMIATAAGDWKNRRAGEVRVWDARKGTELFRLPDAELSAWGVVFTADGHLITTQQGDTALRVFDVKTRKEVKSLSATVNARGLALSPDGKWVGVTAQGNGVIKVWETATWREAYEVPAHPGKVAFTMEFGTDKQTILSAGGDGAAAVWKIPGGDYKLPEILPPAPRVEPVVQPGLEKN